LRREEAGQAVRARLARLIERRPGLGARLRLFGLLLLLVPLFAGLQLLVLDGSPPDVRITSRDVPALVPVERIVERVVERIVYVPVPADEPAGSVTPSPTAASPGRDAENEAAP
jgi:hypothetical protein